MHFVNIIHSYTSGFQLTGLQSRNLYMNLIYTRVQYPVIVNSFKLFVYKHQSMKEK